MAHGLRVRQLAPARLSRRHADRHASRYHVGMSESKPLKDMGPDELRRYAARGEREHAEAEAELRRRWDSFDDLLPHSEFRSILDPPTDGERS